MATPKRAALYLRVSTDDQTTDNQRRELLTVAERKGWTVVAEYEDAGISGAKGRDQRPGFDALLKAAALQRKKFDVVMAWSVDRLGRSVLHLVSALTELHEAGIDLYLHQQDIDTTTPGGKAMYQMMGVFAEFERSMIKSRINAGFARVKATGITKTGVKPGRPKVNEKIEDEIRTMLRAGTGILKTGKALGIGTRVVQRIETAMVQDGQLPPGPERVARAKAKREAAA